MGDDDDDAMSPDAGDEFIRGCTDADAANHDPEATVDDGTCAYIVVFTVDMEGVDELDPGEVVCLESIFAPDECIPMMPEIVGSSVWRVRRELDVGTYQYNFAIFDPYVAEDVPEACRGDDALRREVEVTPSLPPELPTPPWSGCPE